MTGQREEGGLAAHLLRVPDHRGDAESLVQLDGGYRLEAGTEMPPLLVDDDQAVALAVALRTATAAGIAEAAARALTTVRQVMPARLRQRIDALEVTAVQRSGAVPQVDPAVIVAVGAAVRAREVLRFDYAGAFPPRRAEPHHLITWGGRWPSAGSGASSSGDGRLGESVRVVWRRAGAVRSVQASPWGRRTGDAIGFRHCGT